MSVFTNVSDDVLEPGDPIRSVDILAIKNNTEFLFDAASFAILDNQNFTTSGTYTIPAGIDQEIDIIVAILVSGGGGGAARRNSFGTGAGSGGGVGCSIFAERIKNVTGSGTITIGAGGASVSRSNNGSLDGNGGGDTTLVFSGITLRVTGGGGGDTSGDEPVGGSNGVGSSNSNIFSLINKGKRGRRASTTGTTHVVPVFGGGGGNGHSQSSQFAQNRTAGPAFTLFGTTLVGAGGAGAQQTAGNGQAPGGGGGGASSHTGTVTSGAGANGGVRIFVVRGVTNASTINDTTLFIP